MLNSNGPLHAMPWQCIYALSMCKLLSLCAIPMDFAWPAVQIWLCTMVILLQPHVTVVKCLLQRAQMSFGEDMIWSVFYGVVNSSNFLEVTNERICKVDGSQQTLIQRGFNVLAVEFYALQAPTHRHEMNKTLRPYSQNFIFFETYKWAQ
jgi:hypothetical protein